MGCNLNTPGWISSTQEGYEGSMASSLEVTGYYSGGVLLMPPQKTGAQQGPGHEPSTSLQAD